MQDISSGREIYDCIHPVVLGLVCPVCALVCGQFKITCGSGYGIHESFPVRDVIRAVSPIVSHIIYLVSRKACGIFSGRSLVYIDRGGRFHPVFVSCIREIRQDIVRRLG